HVTTNPCINRHILLSVRTRISHGVPYHPGPDLELPQHFAATSVDRLEPPVESSVEDYPARCCQRAAPHRIGLLDAPDFLSRGSIPGDELSTISALASLLGSILADE